MSTPVRCPTCEKEDVFDSSVEIERTANTASYCRTFYDASGELHNHNSHVTTTDYRCEKGHSFCKTSSGACWCGWPTKVK